jgi:hypothetical protein
VSGILVVAGAVVLVGTDVLVVAGVGVVVGTDVLVAATVVLVGMDVLVAATVVLVGTDVLVVAGAGVLVGTDVLVAATVVLGGVVSGAVAIDTDVVVSSRMPSTPAVPKHCEPFWAAERRHCDKASSYCVSVKLDVTHDNIAPHISLHGSKGAPVPSHTNVTGWYRARDGQ